MKHHTCSVRTKGFPLALIGMVNLTSGSNAMFDNIFQCWNEDEFRFNLLVKDGTKFRAIHGANPNEYAIGDTTEFCNDQTNARIGNVWEVVGYAKHTKEGLQELAKLSGNKSLSFATYK